jgi:phage terminase small subunit
MAPRKTSTKPGRKPAAPKKRRPHETEAALSAVHAEEKQVDSAAVGDFVVITEPELHRREAFAQAFVSCGSGAAAARKAGYTGTPASLARTAHRLLGEQAVRLRIRKIQDDIITRIRVDQTTVLAELTRIAFADPGRIVDENGELLPLNKIDEDTRRALAGYKVVRKTFGEDGESVEKEVKFISKDAALDKLGKHLGLWKGAEVEDGKITAEALVKAMLEARERVNRGIQVRQLPAP